MQTIDFLRAILPDDCVYFVATPAPGGKGYAHIACKTIPELSARIEYLERETVQNIFFACSGFRDEYVDRPVHDHKAGGVKMKRQYRIHENVKLVKAFWLDLDVGEPEPNKAAKYPDQRAALVALNDFLIRSGLPKPMVVSSGYGVHVYWPLTASVLPGQWESTAEALKALTVGLGMLTDPSRTADAASVLRPAGTSNRKVKNGVAGSKPVAVMLETTPVSYTEFHAVVQNAIKVHNVETTVKKDASEGLKVNPNDMIAPVGGFQKVSAIKVAERCNQIKVFSETGGVTEPHWYRSLQVIALTVEGDKQAHAWSAKHPEYNEASTQQKLDQVRGMGPTLCATMQTANPDGCKNCPFAGKVSTPLQLGMVIEEAPAPTIKEIVDGEETVVELPNPPHPFKRGTGDQPGLFVEIDQGVPVRFYPYDLYPFEIVNDAGKAEGEGRVGIRHYLPKEGWREFAVRLELIESPRDFIGKFRNNFINPENGKFMVAYMDAYLRELQDKQKIKTLHTKLGWLPDHSFVLGHKLYTPTGVHPAGISSTVSTKIVNSYVTRGEHADWNKAIQRFDKEGLEAHLFSILVGFGAPLFKFTGHGGAIAAMLGETNAGKTLSARAMASIYGSFDPFKAGKNDTFNARIERMGMLSNLPAYMDETTNVKSEEVSELMYQLSSGEGRTRLRSDSTVREAAQWSTIVLTSGNRSMVGRLMEAKIDPEAELMRLFEYTVPRHKWFENEMSDVYDMLEANYGHAGVKYIGYLTKLDPEDIKQKVRDMTKAFSDGVIFDGKERFWYALISCVLYGLWLAHSCGAIIFADVNATYQRLWRWCISQVVSQRASVIANKITSLEALSLYLNACLADRLVVMEGVAGMSDSVAVLKHPASHGKLLVEYNQTKGSIYIDQPAIRNWMTKNQLNPNVVRKDLTELGVIVDHGENDHKVTLGRGTQYKSGQTRVWHVDARHPALDGIAAVLEKDPLPMEGT